MSEVFWLVLSYSCYHHARLDGLFHTWYLVFLMMSNHNNSLRHTQQQVMSKYFDGKTCVNVICIYMYVCMYVCMCMHVCMCVCIYVCMYEGCVCMHVYVSLCMHVCKYVLCRYACMYDTYVNMFVCMYVCMYMCACMCVYI